MKWKAKKISFKVTSCEQWKIRAGTFFWGEKEVVVKWKPQSSWPIFSGPKKRRFFAFSFTSLSTEMEINDCVFAMDWWSLWNPVRLSLSLSLCHFHYIWRVFLKLMQGNKKQSVSLRWEFWLGFRWTGASYRRQDWTTSPLYESQCLLWQLRRIVYYAGLGTDLGQFAKSVWKFEKKKVV